jgi:hypothetical protein
MKNYIKTSVLLTMMTIFLVSSCDVMDTQPFESYSEDLVWNNKATADAFVFQTYANVIGGLYTEKVYEEYITPNMTSYWNWGVNSFAREQIDRYFDSGFGNFGNVRRCNLIIERSMESEGLSETEKAELIGEGKLLRAMLYFSQAKRMGRVVYITKVLGPDDKEEFEKPLTSSVEETYQLILKDIDEAIEGLPEAAPVGRLNKYVAYALKTEVCLQAAAYTGKTQYYDDCIEAADEVIDGPYALVNDFSSMFLPGGQSSSETILAMERSKENTATWGIGEIMNMIPMAGKDDLVKSKCGPLFKDEGGQSLAGWHFHSPTQNLVDDFLVIDQADGQAKKWYETSQYMAAVTDDKANLSIGAYTTWPVNIPHEEDMGSTDAGDIIVKAGKTNGENVSELMYNFRDERFYHTIVYDSCTWLKGELVTTNCNGNAWGFCRGAGNGGLNGWHTTTSNYYFNKLTYDVKELGSTPRDYHYIIYRLGRVYLNKAEAQLCKNNVSGAVETLNMTRVTHGKLPPSTAASLEDAWSDYKTERRCELVLENDYYFSLLRWGKIGGAANHGRSPGDVIPELNEAVTGIEISIDRTRYYIGQIRRLGDWERHFTTKRYLLPIPQGQIDKRTASGIIDTQNEGW